MVDGRVWERDHPLFAVLYALAGATFGYIVYNTGLIFHIFSTSQMGLFGCLQSIGTVGCGDTINGFVYSGLGGIIVGLTIWFIRNGKSLRG